MMAWRLLHALLVRPKTLCIAVPTITVASDKSQLIESMLPYIIRLTVTCLAFDPCKSAVNRKQPALSCAMDALRMFTLDADSVVLVYIRLQLQLLCRTPGTVP